MQIFQYEIEDGISEVVKASGRLVFASQAKFFEPSTNVQDSTIELLKASSSANPHQVDLFYIESILASVGWNKNDDVFDPIEVWKARSTPIDKPFNYMHEESDIIGHLTSSKIVDVTGKVITSQEDLPSQFDIVVGSVIYKHWSDPELQSRMNKLIAEIRDGKWCVSMECLFSSFDYAVISAKGEHSIIKRDENTSFLTKHLRVYGGSGQFEDKRIGRLMRNFSFAGEGLVDTPANDRSKVTTYSDKEETTVFIGASATIEDLQITKETRMTVTQEQYDKLVTELETLKASKAAEAQQELKDAKAEVETLKTELASAKAELEASKEVANAKDENITSLTAQIAELNTKVEEAEAKIVAAELERVTANRKSMLLEKVDEVKAATLVEKFAGASDEMFDALVESLPAKCADKKEDKKDMKDAKADDETVESTEASEDNVSTDIDEAKADDADMTGGVNDVDESVVAKAAAWLSSSVIRATAKKNKGE